MGRISSLPFEVFSAELPHCLGNLCSCFLPNSLPPSSAPPKPQRGQERPKPSCAPHEGDGWDLQPLLLGTASSSHQGAHGDAVAHTMCHRSHCQRSSTCSVCASPPAPQPGGAAACAFPPLFWGIARGLVVESPPFGMAQELAASLSNWNLYRIWVYDVKSHLEGVLPRYLLIIPEGNVADSNTATNPKCSRLRSTSLLTP